MMPASRRSGVWIAGGLALLGAILLAPGPTAEADVCDGICRHLLQRTSAGRQALVSSVWWAPGQVLFRVPVAVLSGGVPSRGAGVACTLVALGLCGYLLHRLLRECGAGPRVRVVVWSVALAHPVTWRAFQDGGVTALVLAAGLLASRGFALRVAGRGLRGLVYAGAGAAALLVLGPAPACCGLLMLGLLAIEILRLRQDGARTRADLLIVALPALYAVALWILMNWLIMADPFYFLHSLQGLRWLPLGVGAGSAIAWAGMAAAVGLAAGLVWRDRGAAAWMLLLAAAAAWVGMGEAEDAGHAVTIAHAAFVAGMAWWLARERGRPMVPGALALLTWGLLLWRAAAPVGRVDPGVAELGKLRAHVAATARYPRVFVCGYAGLAALPRENDGVLEAAMDLDLETARRRYPAETLYVAIRWPTGRYARESIHWKYPGIFERGAGVLVYHSDWGDWRLFEFVDVPFTAAGAAGWGGR